MTEEVKDPTLFAPANIVEKFGVSGTLLIQHYDENGNLKEERQLKNLVVTAGKNFIASRLGSASSAVMGWIEVGTSNTAPAVGNTTLSAPVAGSRTALTSLTSGVPTANAIRHIVTLGAGVGTGALVEAGIFNASSAGTMLCRTTFGVITKGAGDAIVITWDLTIS